MKKGQKEKQRSTKQTHKTKDRVPTPSHMTHDPFINWFIVLKVKWKKDKWTNNDLQNKHIKLKIEEHEFHLKLGWTQRIL